MIVRRCYGRMTIDVLAVRSRGLPGWICEVAEEAPEFVLAYLGLRFHSARICFC
jgi:hypothetical protein